MLRVLFSVVATLGVVFASYYIEGMWLQQSVLFLSGALFAGTLILSVAEVVRKE